MSYKSMLTKIRYLDNLVAKWMLKHFYFLFFQIVLTCIFVFWFTNILKTIDLNFQTSHNNIIENILLSQSNSHNIMVLIMILNSFWLLYIFNCLQKQTNILNEIKYHIIRQKNRNKLP